MNSLEVVAQMLDALNQVKLPYMIVGSLSSNLYGIARQTKDADIVLQLGTTPLSEIGKLLGAGFKIDPQISFETITSTTRYRIQHGETGFVIELFELSDDPHDQQRFARRQPATFMDRPVFIPKPEDVILTKLRWSRAGKRQKDVDDVLNILAVQTAAKLDLPYIRNWADQHGTRELFEKLLTEAEEFMAES